MSSHELARPDDWRRGQYCYDRLAHHVIQRHKSLAAHKTRQEKRHLPAASAWRERRPFSTSAAIEMPKETGDEDAAPRQSKDDANREHDYRDAKPQPDHHHHQSEDDDRKVLEEATDFAKRSTDGNCVCHGLRLRS